MVSVRQFPLETDVYLRKLNPLTHRYRLGLKAIGEMEMGLRFKSWGLTADEVCRGVLLPLRKWTEQQRLRVLSVRPCS